MRALVIDDSRAMRMMLKSILRQLNVETFEAGNGREGLEKLAEVGGVDFVLVDWHMPEMDGCEFVRNIRQSERFASTPVLMVTSESEVDKISEALTAGANEYIMKPFTRDGVLDKLQVMGLAGGG